MIFSINARVALLSLSLFFLLDLLVSSLQSFSQYLSIEVYIYNLSGSTHWTSIIFKLIFPIVIGAAVFAWCLWRDRNTSADLERTEFAYVEESVALGILVGAVVISWPALRFPEYLFVDYNYVSILLSNLFFCISLPLFGVFGLRFCRSMHHPPEVTRSYQLVGDRTFYAESVGPLVGGVLSGLVGSIFAIALGV